MAALKGGLVYRLRKSLRRSWLAWVAALLLAGVAIVSSIAAWQKTQVEKSQVLNEGQVRVATQLTKTISQELDDKLALLDGSTLTRLASAESALAQLEELHQAQPNNLKIKSALAQAQRLVSKILSFPHKLHTGEFNRGRAHLKRAYLLSKEVYEAKPSLKNFIPLIIANRYVGAQLHLIEGKAKEALQLELSLLSEAKKHQASDNPAVRTQMATQYTTTGRMFIFNGRLEEAGEQFALARELWARRLIQFQTGFSPKSLLVCSATRFLCNKPSISSHFATNRRIYP